MLDFVMIGDAFCNMFDDCSKCPISKVEDRKNEKVKENRPCFTIREYDVEIKLVQREAFNK